jgi:hypothetical protein
LPGRTPREALDDYVEPLRDAIHCVTQFRLTLEETGRIQSDTAYALNLNKMAPVQLQRESGVLLTVAQVIRIVESENPRGHRPFEVYVLKYFYRLSGEDGREIFGFHWTPDSLEPGEVTFPHLHVGPGVTLGRTLKGGIDLNKVHVPTGRVSLPAIIRMAIVEFGVKPIRSNWERVLDRSEQRDGR